MGFGALSYTLISVIEGRCTRHRSSAPIQCCAVLPAKALWCQSAHRSGKCVLWFCLNDITQRVKGSVWGAATSPLLHWQCGNAGAVSGRLVLCLWVVDMATAECTRPSSSV